ncbi:MAG: DUF3732 domain-containing protein [Deltaproteobacteria bacterium]|nr:DUF3732 domain-containing protein [Deltaproteobacteria bacterium]
MLRASTVSVPPAIDTANENIDGAKIILNTISSVPYFSLEGSNDPEGYQARLGFRDLMALVFQNQDIVANQNILFYKTHAHAHRERLRNWFPFILGAEDIDILAARQRLQEVEAKLKRLKREYEKTRAHSASWMSNLRSHLNVAREYGLLENAIPGDADSDDLILTARQIIEDVPEHPSTSADDVKSANAEFARYELEEGRISTEIGVVKRRLNDLKRLKAGLNDYGNAVRRRADRLQLSQWLQNISTEAQECPVCGSSEHPKSSTELGKISSAFMQYESESKRVAEIPTSFSREEERLNTELDTLLERQKDHRDRYDVLLAKDRKAQAEFQRSRNMFLFLGHLRASLETAESVADDGELKQDIARLEKEYQELLVTADRGGVKRRVDVATARISQSMLSHLQSLDVEDKYRNIAPRFDVKDLNISVPSTDGNWHYLAEVGSASNWVSFHLALFCSLQEYFTSQAVSSVPSFVIFDQPSQVYFPKVSRGSEGQDADPQYEDEDVHAVKQMFRTVSKSIITEQGAWQGIILDHADSSIYGELEGVHEVEEWRGSNKLIPEEWYKQ